MSSAATQTFRFLTYAQVIKLHQGTIASTLPSQPSMLESAVASPMNIKLYEKEENVFHLAANLAEKIIKNHPYQDGNKRTALIAADMFLKINGYKLQDTPMANNDVSRNITDAHIKVTTNQWDVKQLGLYYKSIATPIECSTPEIIAYQNAATEC